jgi:hypothetical protein
MDIIKIIAHMYLSYCKIRVMIRRRKETHEIAGLTPIVANDG